MEPEIREGAAKKFLYVNRKPPHGTIYALESLEVMLIGAAFEQDVSLAFLGDGVFQLARGQDTKALEVKNFAAAYRALEDYDITKVYVEQDALTARGLTEADLLVPVEAVSAGRMTEIMEDQDVILSF